MKVHIAKWPGGVHTLELHPGTTISQALEVARTEWPDVSFEGSMRVNHQPVDGAMVLTEGQTVILADNIKANQTAVTLRKIPGKDSETSLTFSGPSSIGNILASANEPQVTGGPIGDVEGYTIRLDGVEVNKDSTIPDDGATHRIFLSTKLKGNR
jgi:hypothetical protein